MRNSIMIPNPVSPFSWNEGSIKVIRHVEPNRVLRVGAVAYLNTKPLIYGMQDRLGDSGELSLELPSRLADELDNATIDVGLIPVAEYFRHLDRYVRVSNAVIACDGPVWSVRAFFKLDPAKVRTLAVDEGSRTSVALIQVLYHLKYGFCPTLVPLPINADALKTEADAVLVIGDRAMHSENFDSTFPTNWDLGEVWKELTGLPFVFAMWVARSNEIVSEPLASLLEQCRHDGLENVATISKQSAPKYGLTEDQCLTYLTRYLRFHLGDQELLGLREFQRHCVNLGLAPTVSLNVE